MSPPVDWERRFASYLEGLATREDRAALAALRRGLGKAPGEAAEMFPYVIPWLPVGSGHVRQDACYLIAALFAWHQGSWAAHNNEERNSNLGASFARLRSAVDSESIEKRFVALLNCHRDDLPEHLRHAVGLLKAHDVPIDWAQLLHDVQGWDWEDRSVQRAWAGAFWGAGAATAEAGTDGIDLGADAADAAESPALEAVGE